MLIFLLILFVFSLLYLDGMSKGIENAKKENERRRRIISNKSQ